jgi:hypothetical protein
LAASQYQRPDDDGRSMELKMLIRPDADSFIFADLKILDCLAFDPSDPSVDLRPMERPGPADDADDGLLLPAVQDDGLLLPAVQIDDGLLLPY